MEQSILYLSACLLIGLGGMGAAIGTGIVGSKLLEISEHHTELSRSRHCCFFLAVGAIGFIPLISLEIGLYLIFVIAPDS